MGNKSRQLHTRYYNMKLHEQVNQLKDEKEVLFEGIKELKQYLYSDKFKRDTTVQISDIDLRLNEILNQLYKIEV
jgi:hypothetical protein